VCTALSSRSVLSATARSASVLDRVDVAWAALAAFTADAAAEIAAGSAAVGREEAEAGVAAARAIPAVQRKPRVVRAGCFTVGMKIRRSGTWTKALERADPDHAGPSHGREVPSDCWATTARIFVFRPYG
jgi:hypothetical protein